MFPDLWCCDESSCVGEACIQVTSVHRREEAGIWFRLFLSVVLTYFICFNVFEKKPNIFTNIEEVQHPLKTTNSAYSAYILLQFLKGSSRIF